jgi:hypothetical protein
MAAVIGQFGKDVTGVTDNLAQTYTRAFTPGTGTEHSSVWTFPNSAAGVTLLTATFSVSRASSMFGLEESGLVTSNPADTFAFSASALVTVLDSGASATTAQANEVLYTVFASSDGSSRSFAATDGSTAVTGTGITSGHHGNATDGNDCFVSRREVTATGAYNGTGTCTSSVATAALVTLKRATAAAAPSLMGRNLYATG